MPSLAPSSQVDITVTADSTLTIQNPGGFARVEYPVGTSIRANGGASWSIDIPSGTCRLVTIAGSAFYEMTSDPTAAAATSLSVGAVESVNALAEDGSIVSGTGAVFGLSEVTPVQTRTATGTAHTGAGYYRGIKVRAISGGPQTLTIYDALSATGTPIDTIVVNELGTWFWDRPSDLLPGVGGRRPITTGIHVVVSGGTSRTVDVMVEAA